MAPGGDAAALAALLRSHVGPQDRVLYLAGRDRTSTIETALRGVDLTVAEVYAAEPAPVWSAPQRGLVAGAEAALHFSRRSAALFLAQMARAGLDPRTLAHHCLSADVASALCAVEDATIVVARDPSEAGLIATLASA